MNVFVDETVVVPLLTKMRLPRHVMLEILSRIAGERANITVDDPPSAIGYETWRWGTRYCREDPVLKQLGWVACETDQISGIRHDELHIKLAVCSTDGNTGNPEKSPRNLTERGPASCRLIDANGPQGSFEFMIDGETKLDLWYFCPFFCDDFISLEISRPTSQALGFVRSFSDRLILAKPWEIPGIRPLAKLAEDFADVPVPKARRKTD